MKASFTVAFLKFLEFLGVIEVISLEVVDDGKDEVRITIVDGNT